MSKYNETRLTITFTLLAIGGLIWAWRWSLARARDKALAEARLQSSAAQSTADTVALARAIAAMEPTGYLHAQDLASEALGARFTAAFVRARLGIGHTGIADRDAAFHARAESLARDVACALAHEIRTPAVQVHQLAIRLLGIDKAPLSNINSSQVIDANSALGAEIHRCLLKATGPAPENVATLAPPRKSRAEDAAVELAAAMMRRHIEGLGRDCAALTWKQRDEIRPIVYFIAGILAERVRGMSVTIYRRTLARLWPDGNYFDADFPASTLSEEEAAELRAEIRRECDRARLVADQD